MGNLVLYLALGGVAGVIVFGVLAYLEYRRPHLEPDETAKGDQFRQEPRIY